MNYYEHNPIIKPCDITPLKEGYEVIGTFNPAVAKLDDTYFMLLRVAEKYKANKEKIAVPILLDGKISKLEFLKDNPNYDFTDSRLVKAKDGSKYLTSMSRIAVLESKDGFNFQETGLSILPESEYEAFGCEDPRITKIDDTYYITYAAISLKGICTMLASTKDFKTIKKEGIIFSPDNKDVSLFPEKINGEYVCIHRPSKSDFTKPEMWLAYSKDLVYWGKHKHLLGCGDTWDSARIGSCTTPIKVSKGWLVFYHGATSDDIYSIGAILLDKNDLSKVIGRTTKPILVPTNHYEKEGFVNNVVFVCGQILEGDKVSLYYGACDECVCRVDLSIKAIIKELI